MKTIDKILEKDLKLDFLIRWGIRKLLAKRLESLKKDNPELFIDYRLLTEKFDKIVSVEMIEAVGHKYFSAYFSKIDGLLKPVGIAGIQAIVIPDRKYDQYRKSVDWIQKNIFPGGLLPSVYKINETLYKTGNLNVYSLKEFGLSYAQTLSLWKVNLLKNRDKIKQMGFDDDFLRKWEYYFSYCKAAFNQRNISVVQMIFSRPNNSNL